MIAPSRGRCIYCGRVHMLADVRTPDRCPNYRPEDAKELDEALKELARIRKEKGKASQ